MTILSSILASLYALAMLVMLVYGLNLYWLSMRAVRDDRLVPAEKPEGAGPGPHLGEWPPVTVQLPVYNEAAVVERLIDACAALDYPGRLLEIQVLDDSTDSTTNLVASRVDHWRRKGVDVVHVRRRDREGYKAGALANGLRFARGEFVAVFDADFLPQPDFIRRTLRAFDGPDVGLVQARWAHLNEGDSLLTRVQAFGLDTHFALEQRIRNVTGCFINFNGTAGIWRRSAIDEAGGWSADTLTEDLDLSFRAQLAGWRLKFENDMEVPAELPAVTGAFRSQQFRWAKGSVQTAMRLLRPLWKSSFGRRVKIEGSLHLTAHLVFPFILLAAVLHAPVVVLAATGRGPGEAYFAVLGSGLMGLAGFFLAQLFAQRSLYPDWPSRLRLFPWFMAGTMGLSINNSRAVWEALRRRDSAFVRTPKTGASESLLTRRGPGTRVDRIPPVAWVEALGLAYSVAGAVAIGWSGHWAAAPFQLLLVLGFGMVVWYSFRDRLRSPAPAPSLMGSG